MTSPSTPSSEAPSASTRPELSRTRAWAVVGAVALGAVLALRLALRLIGWAMPGLPDVFALFSPFAAVAFVVLAFRVISRARKRLRTSFAPALLALAIASAVVVVDYEASISPQRYYDFHGIVTTGPNSLNEDRSSLRKHITYRSNRFGLRGVDFAETKPPGVLRIALVGDSFVYGLGVEENETLEAALEGELRARGAGDRVEVLNLGLCGSNLPTHIQMYDVARRELGADVVVMGLFVWNDLSSWDWQDEARGQSRPGLFSALRYVIGREGATRVTTALLVQHGIHPISLGVLDGLMPRLHAVRDPEAAAPPLVVLAYDGDPRVRDRFQGLPNTRYLDAPPDEKYYLPRDTHPTAEGNREFARRIVVELEGLPAMQRVLGGGPPAAEGAP